MTRLLVVIALIFALCTYCLADGQMFVWTDQNGEVHYSQEKPPGWQDKKYKKVGSHEDGALPVTPPLPNPAGGPYPWTNSRHWLLRNIGSGKFIILEDRSIWKVSPIDIVISLLWLPASTIMVLDDGGLFSYKLVNLDDGEIVEAQYIGQE